MNYFSSLPTLFDKVSGMHASICECMGDVAITVWNRLSIYFPFPFQQRGLVERVESLVEKGYDRIVQSNGRDGLLLDAQIEEPLKKIKPHLISLSKGYMTAFKTHVLFSESPSDERNRFIRQVFLEKLEQEFGFEKTKLIEGFSACSEIAACQRIVRELCGNREISSSELEDLLRKEKIHQRIKKWIKAGTHLILIENFAEWMGEMVGSGGFSRFLPFLNPADFVAQIFKKIGSPIGRFSGFLIGGVGSLLVGKGLFHLISPRGYRVQEKTIQLIMFSFYLALESMKWNPLSNFFEIQIENLCYESAFYSMCLICAYLGMWAIGTEETLCDYVRSFNRAKIVSTLAASPFKEGEFFLGLIEKTNAIAFASFHLTYHFEFYKESAKQIGSICMSVWRRKLLHHFVWSYIHSAFQKSKPLIQSEIERSLEHFFRETRQNILQQEGLRTLLRTRQASLTQNSIESVILSALLDPIEGSIWERLRENLLNHLSTAQIIQKCDEKLISQLLEGGDRLLDRVIETLKNEEGINPIPFFYSHFTQFFARIKTPEMRVVLKAYRRRVLSAIDRSKREDWMHQPFEEDSLRRFQEARTDILRLLDREYFQEEERERFSKVFLSIWERCKGSETVFEGLDYILENLHPFIPRAHPREELSFAYMIDLLVLSLVYFIFMRGVEFMREGRIQEEPQEPLNLFSLLAEAKDLLFDLRYVVTPSLCTSLHLKGVRRGIDVALHLAYPS